MSARGPDLPVLAEGGPIDRTEAILAALAPIIGGPRPVALEGMPRASVVAFALLTAWKAIEEAEDAAKDTTILEAIEDAKPPLWGAVERAYHLLQEAQQRAEGAP